MWAPGHHGKNLDYYFHSFLFHSFELPTLARDG